MAEADRAQPGHRALRQRIAVKIGTHLLGLLRHGGKGNRKPAAADRRPHGNLLGLAAAVDFQQDFIAPRLLYCRHQVFSSGE